MLVAVQHVAQRADGRDEVGVREVRRGDAEPHDVGHAEVADDAARDQRLDDAVGVGVPDAEFASRKNRVRDEDRARTSSIATSSNACRAASSASRDSSGGVPIRARSIPGAGSYSSIIANGWACPCQPGSTLTNASWCRAAT